jgi:hypothetical protein
MNNDDHPKDCRVCGAPLAHGANTCTVCGSFVRPKDRVLDIVLWSILFAVCGGPSLFFAGCIFLNAGGRSRDNSYFDPANFIWPAVFALGIGIAFLWLLARSIREPKRTPPDDPTKERE